MIRALLRRHLRAALRDWLDRTSDTDDPPLADVVRATVGAVDRRAHAAEEMAKKATDNARISELSLRHADAELRSGIEDTNGKIEVLDARLSALEGRSPNGAWAALDALVDGVRLHQTEQSGGLRDKAQIYAHLTLVALRNANKESSARLDALEARQEAGLLPVLPESATAEIMQRLIRLEKAAKDLEMDASIARDRRAALPRYPSEWTPSPERGERLTPPAWTVTREVDGRLVVLTFWPSLRPCSRVVDVVGSGWVGAGMPVALPTLEDVGEIADVVARYDELAREAIRLYDAVQAE